MQKTKIWEVGVGHLGVCFGALVWDKPDYEITMFEPHPKYYKEVLAAAAGRKNVTFHNVAIGDFDGQIELNEDETSSFISGTDSCVKQYAKNNVRADKERDRILVDIRKISNYDPGDIDYLRIDTEGHEWFTLKHLISRPKTIHIETHEHDAIYINPYLYEIEEWMQKNNYNKVQVDHADSTYQRIEKAK